MCINLERKVKLNLQRQWVAWGPTVHTEGHSSILGQFNEFIEAFSTA